MCRIDSLCVAGKPLEPSPKNVEKPQEAPVESEARHRCLAIGVLVSKMTQMTGERREAEATAKWIQTSRLAMVVVPLVPVVLHPMKNHENMADAC